MKTPPIQSLSPEQEALIPIYVEKWRSLFLSTERIDRPRAEGALRAAYLLAGNPEPDEVRFLNGPNELKQLLEQQSALEFDRQFGSPFVQFSDILQIDVRVRNQVDDALKQHIGTQLSELFGLPLQICSLATHPFSDLLGQWMRESFAESDAENREQLRQQPGGEWLLAIRDAIQQMADTTLQAFNTPAADTIFQALNTAIWQPLADQPFMQPILRQWENLQLLGQVLSQSVTSGAMTGSLFTMVTIYIDFGSLILDFSDAEQRQLATLRSVVRSCGISIIPFGKLCIVIERPTRILLDADGQIHADDEPAIAFADGAEFYAHHGDIKDIDFPLLDYFRRFSINKPE